MADRTASIERRTRETDIRLALNLDGTGQAEIRTGVGFLDHMLEQVVRHGLLDLEIGAKGDIRVDAHHTVEDVGIALGQAVRDAVGDKRGIQRYGHAYVPLDEALSRVVVDLSGRPGLQFHAAFPRARVGEFDVELVPEFFRGWANHVPATLHVDNLRGANTHHIVETLFKAFGRALRVAVERDPRIEGVVPSTKGSL